MTSFADPSRFRLWALRLAALFVGLVAASIVGEIMLRLVAPQALTPLLAWVEQPGFESLIVEDDELGWRMARGYEGGFLKDTQVSINSLGLRDREYAAKEPGELRVLSLGDSYAFGHGVEHEETYAKQLEAKLRERLGKADVHVVSAGVNGYNTHQMTSELERLSPRLEPDVVISTFIAGNDVAENVIFEEQLQTRLQSPVGFFGQHSHLARLLLRATFWHRFFMSNRYSKNIDYTIECYRRLEAKLDAAGIPYLFLIIPARHQVIPETHPGARLLSALGADGYLLRHNRRMMEHFDDDGISYLDLLPVLTGKDQPTYFDDDPHTNAFGHRLIAEALVERIEPLLRQAVPAPATESTRRLTDPDTADPDTADTEA